MIEQIYTNWLCWLMLVVAWLAYLQIFNLYMQRNQNDLLSMNDDKLADKQIIANVLIGALPLMGLLGTISGLQQSFVGMMTQGVDSQIVSGGIASALLTTQLGLILAIPGWLSMMFVKSAVNKSRAYGRAANA